MLKFMSKFGNMQKTISKEQTVRNFIKTQQLRFHYDYYNCTTIFSMALMVVRSVIFPLTLSEHTCRKRSHPVQQSVMLIILNLTRSDESLRHQWFELKTKLPQKVGPKRKTQHSSLDSASSMQTKLCYCLPV